MLLRTMLMLMPVIELDLKSCSWQHHFINPVPDQSISSLNNFITTRPWNLYCPHRHPKEHFYQVRVSILFAKRCHSLTSRDNSWHCSSSSSESKSYPSLPSYSAKSSTSSLSSYLLHNCCFCQTKILWTFVKCQDKFFLPSCPNVHLVQLRTLSLW